jgi:FkbM family methyltransferase
MAYSSFKSANSGRWLLLLADYRVVVKRFVRWSLHIVGKLILKINSNFPSLLELAIQEIQGKGAGAFSVDYEAKTAINFLPQSVRYNPIVLDIGANVGYYSAAVLRFSPKSTIYAFEPSSVARRKLEERFIEKDSVRIVPLALGSTISVGTLWSDMAGSGMGSLTKRNLTHFGIDFEQSESVEVTTLDTWTSSNRIAPNLIKMDVEGHELDVLKGGIKTLASAHVVQFEFGGCNIDTRTFFQDFWYLFTQAGFVIYRISAAGPIHITHYSEGDECFRTTNFLGVKK